MSTRANIHFVAEHAGTEYPSANIYRHSDGYISGLGADLHALLDEVGKLEDTRFNDAEYLAARFLVWQADIYRDNYEGGKKSLLDFLSVAPCLEDHGDIQYRYKVVCGQGRPKVFVQPAKSNITWREITDAEHAKKLDPA